jgi:hypothetical protein
MRCRRIGRLALSLGLLVTGALGAARGQTAGVTLDRPVAASSGATTDPRVVPAAYGPDTRPPGTIVRGSSADLGLDRPQPTAHQPVPSAAVPSNAMYQWRRPPEETPVGSPTGVLPVSAAEAAPMPVGAGPIQAAPVVTTAPSRTFVRQGQEPEQLGMPTPVPGPEARNVPAWPVADPMVTDGAMCPPCGGCGTEFCDDCPYRPRVYFQADYLAWSLRGMHLPPLFSTGTLAGTPPGALGQPGSQLIYGNQSVNDGVTSGIRVMIGGWFTEDCGLGMEVGFFTLGSKTSSFNKTSFGDPILVRNLLGANTGNVPPRGTFDIPGRETTENVAVFDPTTGGRTVGSVFATSRTSFAGGEANFRTARWCGPNGYLDCLLGFRAVGLDDRLAVGESFVVVAPFTGRTDAPPVGSTFTSVDTFRTSNRFYGPQVGLTGRWIFCGNWSLDWSTKLALGWTQQMVEIGGATRTFDPVNGPLSFNRGILAQPTNSGNHMRNTFGVIPELGLTLGYQCSEHCRLGVGYNFMYWNSVVRAGDQIDREVNVNQRPALGAQTPPNLVGDQRPAFVFRGSDFWAQGITLTMELTW